MRIPLLVALAALLVSGSSGAVPDLRTRSERGGTIVYADSEDVELFYYAPGALHVVPDEDGRPGVRLVRVRQLGSSLYGSSGSVRSRGWLTFRVRMMGPDAGQLEAMRAALRERGARRPELRPLPLEAIEVALQYAGAGRASRRLSGGQFEASAEERASRGGHWRERAYTLSLPDAEIDLLLAAFRAGQTSLSLSYAFLARGLSGTFEFSDLTGPEELVEALREEIEAERARAQSELRVVRADTIAIEVTPDELDAVFSEISFDQQLPPGYLELRIYCYDFRDRLAPALYRKEVEIAAESPGGRPVPLHVRFERSEPDIYVRRARFPTAVRVDRPMRYRITRIDDDGNVDVGSWVERDTWRHELDITDYDARPLSAIPEESP